MADEATIYAALAGDSGVSALVSTRIWDNRVPRATDPVTAAPYIVGRVVSDVPEPLLNETPGVDLYRIQFDIVAAKKSTAKAILAALRTCLEALPSAVELIAFDAPETTPDVHVIKTDWNFWLSR